MSIVMNDKAALVVGGTSGIGLATVRRLLEAGCEVRATGVSQAEVESCQDDSGLAAVDFAVLDVGDSDAVTAYFSGLARLDILVNSAGIGRGASEFTEEGFVRTLEINLIGTMRCCYAARELLARHAGCIVNLGSVMSLFGSPTAPAYASSKGGVVQLSKSLAVAWGKEGIRVNAVAPGWTDTPMTRGMSADTERNNRVLGRTPLGRWGQPEEIARGIVFLCSPDASFITGALLPIDGGYTACGI
ncbi:MULTISPECIES: SDR family NAD(P)-dependent oxidoreductase [unclassified Pseudomonas]|uniref:SDR family NAD(P)-dependent oxidoreductase n=1 Tax=unclassified Pseudomonas TaxID=196821 RepID=UPI0018E73851|nr:MULTISPECIES: SDR family oxidoreductase [unclassified Pseudomonas]MBJ2303734.1 SDR family oxidoreductase [Pseudomonas sp. MF2846]MBK3490273.1 SDR family oxidoreductase [Pseudomonas sp. MF2857]